LAFWQSIFDNFDAQSPTPHSAVIEARVMPGAKWFPVAQPNYAQHSLRHANAAHAAGHPAIVFRPARAVGGQGRDAVSLACRWLVPGAR